VVLLVGFPLNRSMAQPRSGAHTLYGACALMVHQDHWGCPGRVAGLTAQAGGHSALGGAGIHPRQACTCAGLTQSDAAAAARVGAAGALPGVQPGS
jgi:hypothetical protein